MKDKIIFIFAIVIICLAFLLGKSCSKDKLILQPKEIITNYRDTIFPKDTIYKDSLVPQWYTRVDTILKPIYIDSTQCNRIYVYNDTISKKEYDAYLQSHVQGLLRSSVLEVKLKVPLTIKDCTVVKRDTFIYIPSKFELQVGAIGSLNTIAPTIDLKLSKNTFGVGYDIISKSPIISYKRTIWSSKK